MIFTRSIFSSSMDFAISVLSLRFSWNSENTIESVEMEKETGVDGVLLMPSYMWLCFSVNENAPFKYAKTTKEKKSGR